MRIRKAMSAEKFLNDLLGGPLTFGGLISSIRLCEEVSQTDFAKKLGISRSNLCDIEKGRTSVSPDRASRWAKLLGYSEEQFVSLSLQEEINAAGLFFQVKLTKTKKKNRTKAA